MQRGERPWERISTTIWCFLTSTAGWRGPGRGCPGAGEWKTLEKLLPDFAGKRVLDLGCGYGWHCRYAAEHGAASVVGVDCSERMLAVAREKTADLPQVTYVKGAMEDVDFPPESFDVVLSSLAFHYVEDFPALREKIRRWLVPGGGLRLLCGAPHLHRPGGPGLALRPRRGDRLLPRGQLLL